LPEPSSSQIWTWPVDALYQPRSVWPSPFASTAPMILHCDAQPDDVEQV
jgi:hypothetical protein